MAAHESTILQLNFKTPLGSLINGYVSQPEDTLVRCHQINDAIPFVLIIEGKLAGKIPMDTPLSVDQALDTLHATFPGITVVPPAPAVEAPPVPSAPAPVATAPAAPAPSATPSTPQQNQVQPTCKCGLPAKYKEAGVYKPDHAKAGQYRAPFWTCPKPYKQQCTFYQLAA